MSARAASPPDLAIEWLECDGLGGFASSTIGGVRTRRYHALLGVATTPPTGRFVLVNGFDAFVTTDAGRFALTTQRYAPGVDHPDGATRLSGFTPEPWPRFTYSLADRSEIVQELFVVHGAPIVAVTWRLARRPRRGGKVELSLRPLLSGRDHHSLHHENGAFRFEAELSSAGRSRGARRARGAMRLRWRPYEDVPAIGCLTNGAYRHDPLWYRAFLYSEEAARGFDATEDLASPGELTFDLARGEAIWILSAERAPPRARMREESSAPARDVSSLAGWRTAEEFLVSARRFEQRRRASLGGPLERAADSYVVRRGEGLTIVAGYPWFTDWGRDTFIALRGLCLATGRLDQARAILLEWSGAVSEGMLPNRFPDRGAAPEYNSVDASLWYLIAVQDLLAASRRRARRSGAGGRFRLTARDARRLLGACAQILEGYTRGTRFGIRMDQDGLLASGAAGHSLTWMDACANGEAVIARSGKPVEVQALWINALAFAAAALPDRATWRRRLAIARNSFASRFWNLRAGCLYDVVDADHQPGRDDPTIRPNQILAIGGLPVPLLVGERARSVVDVVEAKLLTPMGLRSLAPDDPRYAPRYEGGPAQRDCAYHQGTIWPWLIGPFVEAWLRVRENTAAARRAARERFLAPLLAEMRRRGVHHLCEIADGDPPHAPRGCPFQAWSLGEVLRLDARL